MFTMITGSSSRGNVMYCYTSLQARVVVFVLAVSSFIASWDGQFVFDDSEAVVGNKDLDLNQPLSDLLIHDFWGKALTNTSHKSYRPLTVLTFRWNRWLTDDLRPEGFHIVNIILHAIISILLLEFFSLILHGPWHGSEVAGIVGRADLLCAIFFIGSFLLYVKGSTIAQPVRPTTFSLPHLLLSTILCGLATFSKEQGITVIGVCFAYDVLSICQVDLGEILGVRKPSRSDPQSPSSNGSTPSSSPQSSPAHVISNGASTKHKSAAQSTWELCLVKRFLFLLVSAVALLTVRWRIMGSAPPTFQVHDNPHSFVNGTLMRAINYNYLYAINAWILLSPHWLCFDWSMGCVPTITSLADVRILAVLIFWVFVGLLAWACLKGLTKDIARPVSLGVVLLVVPFLPATNMFFRVGFVVAERVLYLPSTGFCVLVCLGIRNLCLQQPKFTKKVTGCFLVLIVLFGARCVQRSLHWKTEMSLFRAGEKVCPLNAKVHYNIGKLNADKGNDDVAIERYKHAIELNHLYDQAMNNLANILKDRGDLAESERLLDLAVEINPKFSSGWMNRGITKAGLKKYKESEESYWTALSIRRNYPDCYYNLGNMFLDTQRHKEALDAFRNATNLRPTHWNAWNNAIILMDNMGHHNQAIKLGVQALKHLPDQPSILYSLGNAYGKANDYPNSEKYFLRALKFDPGNAALYQNLGVLYHRWGKYQEAIEFYQKAFQMDPGNPGLVENMNMLKRLMNKGT